MLVERIEPIQGHVVVEPVQIEEKLTSGLFKPGVNSGSQMKTGKVKEFDKEIPDARMKVGALVVYRPEAGNEIVINGETLLYLGYHEVKGYRIKED
ncbi:MAG: hypothetical protein ACEPOW_13750 [Bacteroidales bacterium]